MKYTLMHKNIPVADIEIDDELGVITGIDKVIAKEHLPVGVLHPLHHKETVDKAALNHWWSGRSIPASRMGINDALDTIGVYNTQILVTKCLGLSLSDHYWVKPADSDMSWESVNFFDNDFSDDMGDVLFGESKKIADFDLISPDNTSDGNLKKRWKIIDGKRCLLKSGSFPFRQQPFNEVIASRIMERLGIDHVPYSVMWSDGNPYSVCEDFVTKETELVSAWHIMQIRPKANHENGYLHFVNICKELGVDIVPALDRMMVLDYIIGNEDRHFNNFGLTRDPDTLEWLGAAPIYDSGTSLWYNRTAEQIPMSDIICKPFKKSHGEQLRLVSSFDWLNFDKLNGIEDEIYELLTEQKAVPFVGLERADAVSIEVSKRIKHLHDAAMAQNESHDISSTEGDVDEDTAESYGMKIE